MSQGFQKQMTGIEKILQKNGKVHVAFNLFPHLVFHNFFIWFKNYPPSN